MTTARPNRTFTLTSRQTVDATEPIQWPYSDYRDPSEASFPVFGLDSTGFWRAYLAFGNILALPSESTSLDDIIGMRLSKQVVAPTSQFTIDHNGLTDLPDLVAWYAAQDAPTLRLYSDDGAAYVEWAVAGVELITAPSATHTAFDITLVNRTAVGPAFAVGNTILVQLSGLVGASTITLNRDETVWGRQRENAVVSSLLDLGQGAVLQPVETCAVTIPYRLGYTVGIRIIDDLGRSWEVVGTRTVGDRRQLEYTCERTVT